MKQINKKYITFEQAKKLKEKGYLESTFGWWHRVTKKFMLNDILFSMNKLTSNYSAPEQNDLIEWLFTNHKVYIHTTIIGNEETVINNECEWSVSVYKDKMYSLRWGSKVTEGVGYFKSKQEALSAAFDYILENLI